jgi:hypothetical protein
MTTKPAISAYLCHVVGESPDRASRYHDSTIRRTKTFAIAIHIPVILWVVTSFLIASRVFELSEFLSISAAIGSGGLIYLIERLVLSTPRVLAMNIARLVIGVVIALLGASTVDLVIFEREIQEQLTLSKRATLLEEHESRVQSQMKLIEQKRREWQVAQERASCEANGTCGSGIPSIGPVYRELARHVTYLRKDLETAQYTLTALEEQRDRALKTFDEAPPEVGESGLLSRVQALHEYISGNVWALITWVCFFTLILFFELMVVFCKMIFPETVDDEIERIREAISQEKARRFKEATSCPVSRAFAALDQGY